MSVLTTIALEMVLPGLVGQWLDRRWGTQFLVVVGLLLGLSGGLWHLVRLTRKGPELPGRDDQE